MPQAADIMTTDPITIAPSETLQRAAQLMDELNVGALPVCENEQLLGIITDRDIAVRAVAEGQDPSTTRVSEVMSNKVRSCTSDVDLGEVLSEMARVQIRRLMVLDEARRLVGIISVGDFAVRDPAVLASTLRSISLPGRPDRGSALAAPEREGPDRPMKAPPSGQRRYGQAGTCSGDCSGDCSGERGGDTPAQHPRAAAAGFSVVSRVSGQAPWASKPTASHSAMHGRPPCQRCGEKPPPAFALPAAPAWRLPRLRHLVSRRPYAHVPNRIDIHCPQIQPYRRPGAQGAACPAQGRPPARQEGLQQVPAAGR
ncbi:CBS domain-containing protein [Roseateles sp. DB2]|uniref:CBS domain-containing protein n=1 Tax=Roseateles sp. DB2 TaxID=3453717 RepID=UPI003F7198E4